MSNLAVIALLFAGLVVMYCFAIASALALMTRLPRLLALMIWLPGIGCFIWFGALAGSASLHTPLLLYLVFMYLIAGMYVGVICVEELGKCIRASKAAR